MCKMLAIDARYRKYPIDIVERAFKKFPEKICYVPDIDLGCPGAYEDTNENRRWWYIRGAVEEREYQNSSR